MIVAMLEHATEDQIQDVTDHLMKMGFAVHRTTGARQWCWPPLASASTSIPATWKCCPGVEKVHRISAPYKLVGTAVPRA